MTDILSYKGYSASVAYDARERAFFGRVLDLRDVIAFRGTTVDELEAAFQASVEEYLAFCREDGVEPERPFSGRLNLRMPPDLHRRAHIAAERRGESLNALIVHALEKSV